jgi:hypothetical protein
MDDLYVKPTLKVLEYGIRKFDSISKFSTVLLPYKIDTISYLSNLSQIVNRPFSPRLQEITSQPVDFTLSDCNIRWENDQFSFIDFPLVLKSIVQAKSFDTITFVFDTDSTFYVLKSGESIPPKILLPNRKHYHWYVSITKDSLPGFRFYFEDRMPERAQKQFMRKAGYDPENEESFLEAFFDESIDKFVWQGLYFNPNTLQWEEDNRVYHNVFWRDSLHSNSIHQPVKTD